ncbi:MAG: HigA family addiction module antidote protein [Bacteroidales bacterium]|nr:HigA family addiction module antidote protein [Bacteroidales bacterium]
MEAKNDGYVVINDRTSFAVHPGEILQAELKERKIKQKDFAHSIGMQPSHLSALIHGNRSITPEIAAKLEKGLGISASFWKNLQNKYVADCIRLNKRDKLKYEGRGRR